MTVKLIGQLLKYPAFSRKNMKCWRKSVISLTECGYGKCIYIALRMVC